MSWTEDGRWCWTTQRSFGGLVVVCCVIRLQSSTLLVVVCCVIRLQSSTLLVVVCCVIRLRWSTLLVVRVDVVRGRLELMVLWVVLRRHTAGGYFVVCRWSYPVRDVRLHWSTVLRVDVVRGWRGTACLLRNMVEEGARKDVVNAGWRRFAERSR